MSEFFDRVRLRRDHRWAPDRMSAYLDGELARSGRGRMERHVEDCPECRRLIAGLRQMLAALHGVAPAAGGVGALQLAASVRLRLRDRSAP